MSEEQTFKERPETNFLLQLMQRYLPFWPLFVITTGIGLVVSWVYLRSQTRIYVATAKVLLKDPQKNGGDSKVLDALNIFSEKKIVENEIIVLGSSSILEEVVSSLDLYAPVYNQGRVRTAEAYGDDAPVWFRAMDKNNVKGGGKFYFEADWKKRSVRIDGKKYCFLVIRLLLMAVPTGSFPIMLIAGTRRGKKTMLFFKRYRRQQRH